MADPSGGRYDDTWRVMEVTFNLIFLVELIYNAYGHWARDFWYSSWNLFDVVVVIVGMLDVFKPWIGSLPEPMSMLRMLRAFRVFRLFKRRAVTTGLSSAAVQHPVDVM